MKIEEEIKKGEARELVGIDNYFIFSGAGRRDFRKLTYNQKRERIAELTGEIIEHINQGDKYTYGKWLREEENGGDRKKWENRDEQLIRLKSGEVVVTHSPPLISKVPKEYMELISRYRKRGLRCQFSIVEDRDEWGFGCSFVDFGEQYKDVRDMKGELSDIESKIELIERGASDIRIEKPLIGKRKGSLKEPLATVCKTNEERIKHLGQLRRLRDGYQKNIEHILKTRIKYAILVFSENPIGFGVYLGKFSERRKGVEDKLENMRMLIKACVTEEVFNPEYAKWKIALDSTHEMEEAINAIQSKRTQARNKAIHAKKYDKWIDEVIEAGYNPMRYNQFTTLEDIKGGTVTVRKLEKTKRQKKKEEKDRAEAEKNRVIERVTDKYRVQLEKYAKDHDKPEIEQKRKELNITKQLELKKKGLAKDKTLDRMEQVKKDYNKIVIKLDKKIEYYGRNYDKNVCSEEHKIFSTKPDYVFWNLTEWMKPYNPNGWKGHLGGEDIVANVMRLCKILEKPKTAEEVKEWIKEKCRKKSKVGCLQPEKERKIRTPTPKDEEMIGDNLEAGPWQFKK